MDSEDLFRVLSSRVNIEILELLSSSKLYPREIARLLGRDEAEVSRRLRVLRSLGLIECSWERIGGKNVKLCYSLVKRVSIEFGSSGLRVSIEKADGASSSIEYDSDFYRDIPVVKGFIGREDYLVRIGGCGKPVVVVWGLPGTGKTWLVARYVASTGKPVVWYNVSPFSSLRSFLWRTGIQLALYGYQELAGLIKTDYDVEIAVNMLVDGLEKLSAILVVDDYHKLEDRELARAISYIADNISSSKLVVISRRRPYGLPYLRNRVEEIVLKGFSFREAYEYLLSRGVRVSEKEFTEVYLVTQGIPVLLLLYSEARRAHGDKALEVLHTRDLVEYITSEVYGLLSDSERRVVETLSLLEEPVGIDLLSRVTSVRDIEGVLEKLYGKGVVEKYSSSEYSIHDLLRILSKRMSVERVRAIYRRIGSYYSGGRELDLYRALRYYMYARDIDGLKNVIRIRYRRELAQHTGYLGKYIELLKQIYSLGSSDLELRALVGAELGRLEVVRGNYKEALEYLEEVIGYYSSRAYSDIDYYVYIDALTSAAQVYCDTGRQDEAFKYIVEAEDTLENISDGKLKLYSMYKIYACRGVCYFNSNQREKALEEYKALVDISRQLDDPKYYFNTLLGLANIYEALGYNDKALDLLLSVKKFFREVGYTSLEALTEAVIADTLFNLGRYRDAIEAIDKALAVFKKFGVRKFIAQSLCIKAYSYYKLGEYSRALEVSSKALDNARGYNNDTEAIALLLRILSMYRLGDTVESRKLLVENKSFIEKNCWNDTVKELYSEACRELGI